MYLYVRTLTALTYLIISIYTYNYFQNTGYSILSKSMNSTHENDKKM